MNGIDLTHAETETPTEFRITSDLGFFVRASLIDYPITLLDIRPRGEVILNLNKPLTAAQRGTLLLDIEGLLKSLDPAIVVYLQPIQDKNAVRRFRGVTVKEERE